MFKNMRQFHKVIINSVGRLVEIRKSTSTSVRITQFFFLKKLYNFKNDGIFHHDILIR